MNQMEDVRNSVKVGGIKNLSVPPGFTSRTAFTLKRTTSGEDTDNPAPLKNASSSRKDCSLEDYLVEANLQIKCRAWILHDQLDHPEKEPDDTPNTENGAISSEDCLPKGIIWGCSSCSDCLKVPAQWDPEGAHTIKLEEAPVFQPTDEEFMDTLKYIDSIYEQVKPYGLCRIVPPPSWQPPCFSDEGFGFSTQLQRITDFGNCTKRKSLAFSNVQESKRRKISELDLKNDSGNGDTGNFEVHGSPQAEQFQFGPHVTYGSFKKNADFFKESYFQKKSEVVISEASQTSCHEQCEPLEEDIEGEYWRVLENPTAEIEVLCRANLDPFSLRKSTLQSLEAKTSNSIGYQDSGWNLSNLSRLPGSLLSIKNSDYSGDLAPKFRIGMCFSTFPWEIAEQHLYSLCHLYLGSPKIWYGVPGRYFHRFQAAVKKHLPGNFTPNPELLHKLAVQISPSTLKAEGVPVYRCVQRPTEFILFVPGAYHTGFDCGFNVSESVCFATLDWLHHVQGVSGLYREKQMRQLICHEKLLFEAAEKAVKSRWDYLIMSVKTPEIIRWKDACGAGKAIAVTLAAFVKAEERKREFLCTKSQSKQMDRDFDEGAKKECFICNSMLYLSAAYCGCNTRKYACLKHTRNLCSCAWSEKVFLLRFNIAQLKLLVEATEGKFHAINKWVKQIKAREPNQCVLVSEDDSSIAKSLEVGGETSNSPAKLEVNSDSCTRLELAVIMSNLGVTTFDTLSPEADDSSKSDDDSCFLPFGLMEGKKPLAESHSASNGKTEVVFLSSDDED